MTDCKNCKYTDEYCASGDCNKTQANDLACNKISLTEQMHKGELPEGFYYVNDGAEVTIDYYLCDYWERHFDWDVQQVLAPVPSYEEWKALNESDKRNAQSSIRFSIEAAIFKELLRECSIANTALVSIMDWLRKSTIPEQRESCEKLFEKTQELQKRLDEALK